VAAEGKEARLVSLYECLERGLVPLSGECYEALIALQAQ